MCSSKQGSEPRWQLQLPSDSSLLLSPRREIALRWSRKVQTTKSPLHCTCRRRKIKTTASITIMNHGEANLKIDLKLVRDGEIWKSNRCLDTESAQLTKYIAIAMMHLRINQFWSWAWNVVWTIKASLWTLWIPNLSNYHQWNFTVFYKCYGTPTLTASMW